MEVTMAEETQLSWSDRYLLGFTPMDDHHREFVESLGALANADAEALPKMLDRFIAATEAHFQDENDWMVKNDFPARDCHIGEHQAVLDSLYEARDLVAGGRADFMPNLIQALTDWFPGHADYLDSALAQWMSKRTLGAIPVVLKKRLDFS
jgi:hemerythrin